AFHLAVPRKRQRRPSAARRSRIAREQKLRLADLAALDRREVRGQRHGRVLALFDDDEGIGSEPAAGSAGGEGRRGERAAVGRVAEDELEGRPRAGGAEAGGVAAEEPRLAAEAEGLDV